MKKQDHKYIFVVGGVMSGVGKGVATSSIAKILQSRGFKVTAIKIDPYVNVDAGTMNPTEHGEVFVLGDGMECDQDMGNYERFIGTNLTKANYMTTGSVYLSVINRERNLGYKGKFVSVVPYIPMEVINRLDNAAKVNKADIVITEIGGTVGEYENLLFLEAIKMLKIKHPKDVAVVLVSFLPLLDKDNEIKTKPTQHAVRALNSAGIQPDIILARANVPIDKKRRDKLAFHSSVRKEDVVPAQNVESIYDVPLNFEKVDLSGNLLEKLNLRPRQKDMRNWKQFVRKIHSSVKPVRIGIVGKYFGTGEYTLSDAYISVIEAVKYAAYYAKRKPIIEWLNAEDFEKPNKLKDLKKFDGIIVPGGFGKRGIKGKLDVIKYARENKIPFFGLCYGMQLMVVEYARNVLKLKDANTTEINPNTKYPVIDVMHEQKEKLAKNNYGGTMRLGIYPANLKKDTIAQRAYDTNKISERHRHRYEVNPKYIEKLNAKGMIFSGVSPDKRLMEIAELSKEKHPFFLATQFHPEFQARPLSPHPLFTEFIKTCIKK
ncbi:MAG: CTP synthase [Candidatus Pacebacteria bacterium]|jgi:CTP synthase|nr:CTP synthetase [Parcubacteria group bacterium]MDP6249460.1 CTP synthase [Candidatus Paceibacterota bacterium]MDP7159558.1 CTP synthase [Candidatus Paceibacterota bacterium]MDP7366277.1 CTP synthase [Candidatus Paceibacterota bacterium]MDP7466166.1 CTP synthase [Candidatus Paceibacterota bacterium]|tara:strand:+ start:3696 stop:5330 length:1635 start_codon:yes stop_codon:yes gene_type:complete